MRVKYTFTVSEAERFLSDYYADTMGSHNLNELEINTEVDVTIIPDVCNESDCCKDDVMENYGRAKTERKDWDDDLNSSQFEHRDSDGVTYEEACVCDANEGNPCDECQRVIQSYIDNKNEARDRQDRFGFYDNRNDGTGWGSTNDDIFVKDFERVRLKAGRNRYFIIDRESDTLLATRSNLGDAQSLAYHYEYQTYTNYANEVEMLRYDRHEN